MRSMATLACSCVLLLVLGSAMPVLAGPAPPCTKAVSSKNADFLVISNFQLEPLQSSEGIGRRIQQFSFEVFPKEKFINAKDRMTAPATYWTDGSPAEWGVVLDSRTTGNWAFTSFCPLPLITDDGEFLILLATVPAMSADYWAVLRIYRWDRMAKGIPGHGRLVREIPLEEIWSPLRLASKNGATDETPEWYAGGTFNFSSDGKQLIHKTRWGNTVRISLGDGSVSNDAFDLFLCLDQLFLLCW